jgi:hypothetical protein
MGWPRVEWLATVAYNYPQDGGGLELTAANVLRCAQVIHYGVQCVQNKIHPLNKNDGFQPG